MFSILPIQMSAVYGNLKKVVFSFKKNTSKTGLTRKREIKQLSLVEKISSSKLPGLKYIRKQKFIHF